MHPHSPRTTAVIILAAGASVRLGRPKQLLILQGKPLLAHAVDAAITAAAGPVLVVIGAHAEEVANILENRPVEIVQNRRWESGMGSSIHAGMARLMQLAPDAGAVLLMLCDQPFVDAQLLRLLMQQKAASGKGIVAASYNETSGAPVLIDRRYFNALMALPEDAGAKALLRKYSDDVAAVDFPGGSVDVDTAQDWERLRGACR